MIVFSYERNIEQFVIEYITNFLYNLPAGVSGTKIYNGDVIPADATIIIYVQKLPEGPLPEHLKVYLLNIEQLSIGYWANTIRGYLDRGVDIIDYSWKNVELLRSAVGAERIHYIPYLYNPEEIITPSHAGGIAFFGWMSPRRIVVSDALKAAGLPIDAFNGIYGAERDKRLAAAKAILNVHYRDDYKILETIRISRLLFSGFLVISEASEQECNPLIDICVETAANLVLLPYELLCDGDTIRGILEAGIVRDQYGAKIEPPHNVLAVKSKAIIGEWASVAGKCSVVGSCPGV